MWLRWSPDEKIDLQINAAVHRQKKLWRPRRPRGFQRLARPAAAEMWGLREVGGGEEPPQRLLGGGGPGVLLGAARTSAQVEERGHETTMTLQWDLLIGETKDGLVIILTEVCRSSNLKATFQAVK